MHNADDTDETTLISMKRNPQLRAAVLRGYFNLVFFFAIIAILLLPIVLHPDVRGLRITPFAVGSLGSMLTAERFVRRKWSWLFAGGCMMRSLTQLGIAYFLATSSPFGQTIVQLLALVAVSLLFVGLPWMMKRQGTHKM